MQIYLPIAEVSVNAFLLLGLGGMVGILSGMFGVGGGFLMTPLLFFIGIPPAVAVATEANQIVASSFSGVLAHFRRKTVDLKMGTVLLTGGLIGAALGCGDLQLPQGAGSGRSAGHLVLRRVSGRYRQPDVRRKPARASACKERQRHPSQAQTARLGACVAVQNALSDLGPLYLGHSAGSGRAIASAFCPRSWAWAAVSSWCPR